MISPISDELQTHISEIFSVYINKVDAIHPADKQ
jgi:hypothetical protein